MRKLLAALAERPVWPLPLLAARVSPAAADSELLKRVACVFRNGALALFPPKTKPGKHGKRLGSGLPPALFYARQRPCVDAQWTAQGCAEAPLIWLALSEGFSDQFSTGTRHVAMLTGRRGFNHPCVHTRLLPVQEAV